MYLASTQELRQQLEETTAQLAASRKEVEVQVGKAAATRELHRQRVQELEKEVVAAQAAAVEAASAQQVADGLAQEARRWGVGGYRGDQRLLWCWWRIPFVRRNGTHACNIPMHNST